MNAGKLWKICWNKTLISQFIKRKTFGYILPRVVQWARKKQLKMCRKNILISKFIKRGVLCMYYLRS